jgi:chemotaxis protein histidine kinase CheA
LLLGEDIGVENAERRMAEHSIDRFASLRRTYAAQLGPTMEAIRRDWARVRKHSDLEAAERVRATVHRLTGSGATFGFPDLSDAAREAEDLLEWIIADGRLADAGVDRIEASLTTLVQIAIDVERDPDATAKPN